MKSSLRALRCSSAGPQHHHPDKQCPSLRALCEEPARSEVERAGIRNADTPEWIEGAKQMTKLSLQYAQQFLFATSIATLLLTSASARCQTTDYEFNDSHFHLTNNIQEGPEIHDFLNMMGNHAGRVDCHGLQVSDQGTAGPHRSHDYRLQSHGHVRRRPYSPSAANFSGRIHRNRRV